MTEAIYLEVSEKTEAAQKAGRRVSVSGMLKFLGVSRSGYLAWLHHVPSDTEKRREAVKAKIQDIYNDSKQNYGAPKIAVELRKTGEVISERTVGTYMRQMGIRAQWSKPWTITTKDSDFSTNLQNILDEIYRKILECDRYLAELNQYFQEVTSLISSVKQRKKDNTNDSEAHRILENKIIDLLNKMKNAY